MTYTSMTLNRRPFGDVKRPPIFSHLGVGFVPDFEIRVSDLSGFATKQVGEAALPSADASNDWEDRHYG
jgi:hypothetical protein